FSRDWSLDVCSSDLASASVLTLGELWLVTCFTQTHFLTLNFTGITGYITSGAQSRTQSFIVLHQCTGNTVTDCTGLTVAAAAVNVYINVKLGQAFSQFQRLTNYHAGSFTAEVHIQRTIVNYDAASTRTQENTCSRSLATAGTIVLSDCHDLIPVSVLAVAEQYADARYRHKLSFS